MNDSNIANNVGDDIEEEAEMGQKYRDTVLFPADRLIDKMSDNLARAEALVNDEPLRTEKTAELESMGQGEE